jgi:hypothetical protein
MVLYIFFFYYGSEIHHRNKKPQGAIKECFLFFILMKIAMLKFADDNGG